MYHARLLMLASSILSVFNIAIACWLSSNPSFTVMNASNTPSAHNFASMDGCASSMVFYRSGNSFTTFVCLSEAQFMKGEKVHNTSATRLSSDLNRDPCNLHTAKSFILPPLAIPLTFNTTIYHNEPQTMPTSPSIPKEDRFQYQRPIRQKTGFPEKTSVPIKGQGQPVVA